MDKDVLIIGGGIVGLCCALSLQSRGFRVRLVEPDDPGQGASAGNAGVISPWSFIPQAVPGIVRALPRLLLGPGAAVSVRASALPELLGWGAQFIASAREDRFHRSVEALARLCGPSIELFRKHLAGTGAEHLIADSWYLHAYRDPDRARIDAREYLARSSRGATIERLDQTELLRLEPALSPRFRAAIAIKGQARARSPGEIGRHLARRMQAQGGTLIRDRVIGLAPKGQEWSVQTTQATISSPNVVIAAGAWSMQLLAPLGLRLPLMAERGYHVQFTEMDPVALTHSIMDMDHRIVASSMLGGVRVAGMAEFAAPDAPASARMTRLLGQAARRMLPGLQDAPCSSWSGARPSLPDSLPILGRLDGRPGLFAAFGHSHYGLMTAPASGELLASLIAAEIPESVLYSYRCDRFG